MLEAAQRENLDVDRLSFTGCLQILQARLPECDSTTPQRLDQWFAKKRPEHRGRPPLKKTFAETVVIT
jgi:hypothetical protein